MASVPGGRGVASLAVALLIAGVMPCGGCVTTGSKPQRPADHPPPMPTRGRSFEPDLPVPAGFTLVEDASEDRSTGSRRLYLRHEYRGKADKYALRTFYREQMPLARWTRTADGNIEGEITMVFEKQGEYCTITIRDADDNHSGMVNVRVVVARQQGGPAPPERKQP